MAATTKARVLIIAPELSTMTDDQFSQAIEYAALIVTTKYGTRQQFAQDYYVAHLLTLTKLTIGSGGFVSGALSKERTEKLEKAFSSTMSSIKDANRYDETVYGRVFNTVPFRAGGFKYYNPGGSTALR